MLATLTYFYYTKLVGVQHIIGQMIEQKDEILKFLLHVEMCSFVCKYRFRYDILLASERIGEN